MELQFMMMIYMTSITSCNDSLDLLSLQNEETFPKQECNENQNDNYDEENLTIPKQFLIDTDLETEKLL